MAHQIESMMYLGATPWHSLGTKLNNPPTAREAIIAAGLNWEVATKAIRTVDGEALAHKATYRVSDGRILGVVGPHHKPYQNAEAFAWFDPFLAAGQARFETAGSLAGGRKVWILAKLSRDPAEIVKGDTVEKYILLSNAHDGSMAIRVGFTPIRVVCANTLAMAVSDKGSKLLRVRHTKNVADVMLKVRDIMNAADAAFEATAEQYRALARCAINSADLAKYVRLVFPKVLKDSDSDAIDTTAETTAEPADGAAGLVGLLDREIGDHSGVSVAERQSKAAAEVTRLFEEGKGHDLPGVRGTMWAAFNGVAEYVTHHRGRDDERRLAAQFSDGAALTKHALTTALAFAAAKA